MVIHPPLLYLGYVGFIVPFAFAIGSVITRQPGDAWIHTTRRWAIVTWLFQSTGILLGAGWAYARLPWLRFRPDHAARHFDPLMQWLALDGFGFHEGYFSWARAGESQVIPPGIRGYARRAFDHGLGRSLWFVNCADARRNFRRAGRR